MSELGRGGGFAHREEDHYDDEVREQRRHEVGPSVDESPLQEGADTHADPGPAVEGQEAQIEEAGTPRTDSAEPEGLRLGAAESADDVPAADRGISAVASRAGIPWGTIGGLAAAGLAASVLVWNIFAPSSAPPAAPPAPVAAPKPPDLLTPPPKPVAETPPPVPSVRPPTPAPRPPQAMPADDMAGKAQRAPLMALATQQVNQPPRVGAPGAAAPRAGQSELDRALQGRQIMRAKARSLGDPSLRISAGTTIPCILDTAIDTTVPGVVRCHLDQPVLSANGAVILLDTGTVVVGEYGGGMKQGQERIQIIWTRAETPHSIAIDLYSPAADALGRGGADGLVETYFWTRFGAAVMFSVLQDVGSIAQALAVDALTRNQGGNNAISFGSMGQNTQNAAGQVGQEQVRQTLSIAPVMKKNQGERISISVVNDLDFSDVYSLERRQ